MRPPRLSENATFAGIVLGMILGAIYTLLHISKRGQVRRRDLTQFGAASAELKAKAAIQDAKQQAKARRRAQGELRSS